MMRSGGHLEFLLLRSSKVGDVGAHAFGSRVLFLGGFFVWGLCAANVGRPCMHRLRCRSPIDSSMQTQRRGVCRSGWQVSGGRVRDACELLIESTLSCDFGRRQPFLPRCTSPNVLFVYIHSSLAISPPSPPPDLLSTDLGIGLPPDPWTVNLRHRAVLSRISLPSSPQEMIS